MVGGMSLLINLDPESSLPTIYRDNLVGRICIAFKGTSVHLFPKKGKRADDGKTVLDWAPILEICRKV